MQWSGGFAFDQCFQQVKQFLRIVAGDAVVGGVTVLCAVRGDEHQRCARTQLLQARRRLVARDVIDFGAEHHAVDLGEAAQRLDALGGAVGGDDVHLRRLDHQLARGDVARVLPLDHQEAGTRHDESVSRSGCGVATGKPVDSGWWIVDRLISDL